MFVSGYSSKVLKNNFLDVDDETRPSEVSEALVCYSALYCVSQHLDNQESD